MKSCGNEGSVTSSFREKGLYSTYTPYLYSEVALAVAGPVTQHSVLDELEARYPMLCGMVRDHVTHKHRPMVRFFANEEDVTHQPPDAPLQEVIASGARPLLIVGAIAGC